MSKRTLAWVVLAVFLLGMGLAFYALMAKNTALSTTAVFLMLAGILGNVFLQRSIREEQAANEAEERRQKQLRELVEQAAHTRPQDAQQPLASPQPEEEQKKEQQGR